MRRNREEMCVPSHSLCIICEGTRTEPFFYKEFIAWLERNGRSHDYSCKILPPPIEEVGEDGNRGRQKGKRKMNKAKVEKPNTEAETILFPGKMPLNWVNAGINMLETYSEVWVVFDKDGHSAASEAFEKVYKVRKKNKRLNVIFSSRCFEFYLLQHHEFNLTPFNKSECNGKKDGKTEYYHCCKVDAVVGKACQGDKCINGYARIKNYWTDTKNTEALDCAKNLWCGIYNASKVKWHSIALEDPSVPLYERNPYLNTYRLTLRLMDMGALEHGDCLQEEKGGSYYWRLERKGNKLCFFNQFPAQWNIKGKDFQIFELLEKKGGKTDDISRGEEVFIHECEDITLNTGERREINLVELLGTGRRYARIKWRNHWYFCSMLEETILDDIKQEMFELTSYPWSDL